MQKHHELPEQFAALGIEVRLLKALGKMGFECPTDIQRQMIPPALEGKDMLGQARTGTGKTAAFGLPILQRIDPTGRLQAICLAPTRELAVQVATELKRLCEFTDIHIVAVYGGQKVATQLHLLGRKPHFVVGTPGRVMDFIQRGALRLDKLRFVVLDEVDRMLDIGFRDDIKQILGCITSPHQTMFVSATIEREIKTLARQFMQHPVDINVSRDHITVDEVDQSYVTVEPWDKFHVLQLVLGQENPRFAIVFCNTKHATRKLAKKLHDAGINAADIHGDLDQKRRDRVMDRFRKHKIRVLVATDLAARGIDVTDVSHIINYDVPLDPEIYVHRIGRTARMGARGVAIMFVKHDEGDQITNIEQLIDKEVPQRTVDGFKPRPPRERPKEESRPRPVSRYQAAVHDADAERPAKLPPKTLGSRFRPSRGRRRL